MKVIFLDMDGVLNSDEYFDTGKNKGKEGIEEEVDVDKIKLLKEAIRETQAKVVLTASCRHGLYGKMLRELLAQNDIYTEVTPYINHKRGAEIKEWLSKHKDIEDYVILDDEIFKDYDEELMKKLIKISNGNGIGSYGEGLQKKDVEEIIKRLGRKRQRDEDELEI